MATRSQAREAAAEAPQERVAEAQATAPPEVSPELKAERLAEADAQARAAELAALGDHQAAQEAQARADAADVRATVLEGQAEVYARWEADTAAERHEAELARSELEARAKTAGRAAARAEAETATARESTEVPDPADTTSDLVEPGPAYERGAEIGDPDAAADALVASLDQVELPEVDTTSPIEDPELAAVAEEHGHPLPGPRGRGRSSPATGGRGPGRPGPARGHARGGRPGRGGALSRSMGLGPAHAVLGRPGGQRAGDHPGRRGRGGPVGAPLRGADGGDTAWSAASGQRPHAEGGISVPGGQRRR